MNFTMRLEDEIKVSKFRNRRQKLHVNLIYTHSWVVGRAQKTFQAHGITMQQFNILRILRGQYPEPSTIQLLKERMLDKQPDASRLIDRLCQKEYVASTVCKDDRRKVDVVITDAGLALLERMEDDVNALEKVYETLTDPEIDQLNDLLDRIRNSV
jgi:DNA-binding MarR family transcriptional regulator